MQADSAAQSPQSTGERARTSVRVTNQHLRVATLNVRTCPAGDDGLGRLGGLASQLRQRRISLAGLQELRRTGSGQADIPDAGAPARWTLLWSGPARRRQHGVGLLMAREWDDALISYEPINERLLTARFAGDRQQGITVIVAYSPTDCSTSTAQADAFYSALAEQCMRASDRKDLIITLGDFNAAVGKDPAYECIGRQQPASEPASPSANGERLLAVATAASLRVANTFFRHKPVHQLTHTGLAASGASQRRWRRRQRGVPARGCSVKDYILVSAQHMRSVRDCRVLRGIAWDSDHYVLALDMRLSLRAREQQRPPRRPWDSSMLLQQEAKEGFCAQLENRFELLQPLEEEAAAVDSQQEYGAFVAALTEAASAHLQPAAGGGQQRRHRFALSRRTQGALGAAKRAHQAWLASKSSAARSNWRRAQRQADKAVRRDQQSWTNSLAAEAKEQLARGNLRGFAQVSQIMAGRQRRSKAPASMHDPSAQRTRYGERGVEQALSAHFDEVLGGRAELTQAQRQAIEAEVLVFEALHVAGQGTESAGDEPTLAEVAESVKALRNHAAPGADLVDARQLKAGPEVMEWLHRVVVAVWRSGRAPVEWKRALIVPLYKGKGARDQPGSYRGISLLSIPGKVYASILLHRVDKQVEGQLSEAQCGFRRGRSTVDAIYTLRALRASCGVYNTCLAVAYIDLTKAYDSINRWALWRVLRVYNVHPKLIALLEDLHTGTTAAVKLGGRVGDAFDVTAGVRQGCVIAPMLFNIFMDLVMRRAQASMPQGCGVSIHVNGREPLPAGQQGPLARIVMLMYADDVALLSHDPAQLAAMLAAVDQVAQEYGLTINAAKTKIQVQQPASGDRVPVAAVSLPGGEVDTAEEFKYLGSWMDEGWGVAREVAVRKAKAWGVFNSFSNVWSNKKLGPAVKGRVYDTFVLPHLEYAAEAWNCTAAQMHTLEVVHNDCLRHILGVRRTDHHTLHDIYAACGSEPLELRLIRRKFQWLGHVMRMPADRYPAMVYGCVPESGHRGRGRPVGTFDHTHKWMLGRVGVENPEQWLEGMYARAQDRAEWRRLVKGFSLLEPRAAPAQRASPYPSRARREGGPS